MSSRIRLNLDVYLIAGITVLGIASAIIALLIISNWGSIVMSSNRSYYLIAMLVAFAVPLAMLLLYIFNIKSSRAALRSREEDIDHIGIGGEPASIGQSVGAAAKEIDISISATSIGGGESRHEGSSEHDGSPEEKTQMLGSGLVSIESIVREEVNKGTANLISKIDSFSQEVQGIKRELDEIKSTVENTMIDIRSLLSEISNPFNYMRRFATESDMKELGLNIPPNRKEPSKEAEGRGSQVVPGEAEKPSSMIAMHSYRGDNKQGPVISVDNTSSSEFNKEFIEIFSKGISVSKLMRIIMFVGDNLQTLGRDGLLGIVELGVSSGVIPKESMDIVAKVISLMESTKAPPRRLAVTLHKLARSLGISDKEAEFLAMALSEG